jgi:hypothetical protein
MLRFKLAGQFVELYYSAVTCALNMEKLISKKY